MRFRPGLELCRRYHDDVVGPILLARFPGLRYAAARLDSGSELLGFDTARSMDHDWGARLQIFVADGGADIGSVCRALDAELPAEFLGVPTRFAEDPDATLGIASPEGVAHGVSVVPLGAWFQGQLGFDPRAGVTAFDWLATPTQRLAEITGGAVYHDDLDLAAGREQLGWYPEDVWRYVLACQWARIGQEDHLAGRAAEVGDEIGSVVLAGRLVRDLMRLCLLLARRYPPYGKWLGTAFGRLPGIGPLRDALAGAITATDWATRERHLRTAYEAAALRCTDTGLIEPLDPRVRQFHSRPWRVLGTERFSAALTARITDPWLRTLPRVGAIDQFVDNTDVLARADRARSTVRGCLNLP